MQVWEIKPTDPNPRNGLRDMKCNGKRGSLTVLQDWVSDGQAHPESLQGAIYLLGTQVLPPVHHLLSTTG